MLKSFLDVGPGYLKNLTKSCPWQPSCLNLNLWKPSFFFQTLNFIFSSSTAFNMLAWKFPHLPSLQSMAGSNLQWKVVSFTSKYGKRRGKGAMKNRVGVTWCRVVGRISHAEFLQCEVSTWVTCFHSPQELLEGTYQVQEATKCVESRGFNRPTILQVKL